MLCIRPDWASCIRSSSPCSVRGSTWLTLVRASCVQARHGTVIASTSKQGSAPSSTVKARCSGYTFPPFIVLERGITGSQWAAQLRRFSEQLTMMEQLAEMLATLHAAGKVHRDLKPANVIFVLNSTGAFCFCVVVPVAHLLHVGGGVSRCHSRGHPAASDHR